MNNRFGELTKKAEILEINFLQEMGIETIGKYPEVENHIDKMIDILIEKNDDLQDISDINVEELEQDLEDKTNAIDSASCTLYNLKKVVESMRKSDMKTTLLSYIEDMEMDLC
jgi:polyhydroxyalkanoate synthesis regulator phasin